MIIEQTKGLITATHDINIDQAFALIRTHARNHHTSLHTLAEAIVRAGIQL